MRWFVPRLLRAASLIYFTSLGTYLLLRWAWPTASWWLSLADTIVLYLLAPALPLLLIGLLARSRTVLPVSALPAVLFVLLYGELFLPKARATGTEFTFTVMTYNVLAINHDLQGMATMILDEDPDVVALQELTPEIADSLTAKLADTYPYRALAPRSDYSGAGVYSRLQIKSEETFTTSAGGHLAQHLVLDVAGQDVHLFNLHPHPPRVLGTRRRGFPPLVIRGFDTDRQTRQVEEIMEMVEKVDGPVVVPGDFNLTDQTRQYRRITRSLRDAHREAGWGFGHTFPASSHLFGLPMPYPLLRIDYVFHSPDLAALEAHLGDNASSDHRPVIATLGLKSKP